ncbi:MAG: haloacid dehalogenase-like hydrolase [Deltaproteobacteria bacterium]|nr:MAG: haloacid dehalogenase-like hydrolase [Deltaproteobacteria bacterium]
MPAPALVFLFWCAALGAEDPLPSWRDGANKAAILAFVEAVSTRGSPMYVPPTARLAAFDADGTLWPERPHYLPVLFALHRLRSLAPAHPEWDQLQPFAKALHRGADAELSFDEMMQLQQVAFGASTPEQFAAWVEAWLHQPHPSLGRSYASLAYAPMLELVAYLRQHGFVVALDSGAEAEFVRGVSRILYAMPPYWVVGNHLQMVYEARPNATTLRRLSRWQDPFNGGAGKVINLVGALGCSPIFAVGNADNDLELLQYTARRPGPHFTMLLQHDDAAREFKYTVETTRIRAMAARQDTHLVSMQADFATIFLPP